MKKFSYIFVAFAALFILNAIPLHAQTVVLYDQFDSGDGKWNTGWIEGSTSVTFSIDTNGVLSGKNSYLANIVSASSTTYFIQRVADCPLLAGKIYTVSFKAVANTDIASINVLFELAGDPYTKRLNETPTITTTPQVITYTMTSTENVPTNQLKLHYGGTQNNNTKIWVDSVIVTYEDDPSLVSQWGTTTDGYGNAWANGMLNDSSTAAGNAGITGVQPMPSGTNGASLLGRFNTLQVTTGQTIVVSGQLEYVGGGMGSVYTPLRYALTNLDSLTLENQYTDSAKWVSTRTDGSQNHHYGYEFTPRSGTGVQPNGGAGNGSVWQVINGNWASTYSNGGGTVGPVVDQAPRNAEISAGTYNWAISVQMIDDTTSEVRWSLVKTDNSYWFAGIAQDTALTDKVNSIAFWIKDGEVTGFNVKGVRAELGDPITIPPKPWQGYYLDLWGVTTDGYGNAWTILNDSDYVDGNGSIGGPQPMPTGTNGASIRAGFGQDVEIPTDKAVVLTGKLEYAGGGMGSVYTPLRYAITNLDSLTLENQYTDSAKWVSTRNDGSQNHHYGWEFTPRSLNGQQPNGGAGNGSVWQVINGNWASTYSNGGGTVGPVVDQVPRNAELSEGTYNWAISVQQINDTTDEIRWYIEAVHAAGEQASYWFGGIAQDTTLTNKLNGVAFWLKDGEATQFNVIDAYIDLGNPIEIPPKPWQKFYIPAELWGFYSRTGGWQMSQPDVDGNTSISGSAAVTDWASVRGGFGRTINFSDLPPDTALVVTGDLEFVGGGFDGWSGLRFGLFYSDSAGVVDSTANGPMWSGTEAYSSGYLFCPNSGTNANVGGVINSTWLSTNGADNYILSNDVTSDVAGANTYHFILGFKDMGNGQIGIGYSIKSDSYTLEGVMMDDHDPLATTKFNAINFSISSTNATTTGLNISNVLVDVASVPTIGVIDNKDNSIPTVYSLSQNYPNPFNPTTNIKFGLPKAGDVSLVVYDILGRKVAELVHGNLTAGYHIVNFNATNLASGVYFYRIKAGDFVSVKKLMLLK
jgi:hypothetical protein